MTPTETLNAWVREVIQWHFNPETGCPFWLDFAKNLSWDPREEIHSYADLSRLDSFRTNGCAVVRCAVGCRRVWRIGRSIRLKQAAARACRSRASTSTTSASITKLSATRYQKNTSRRVRLAVSWTNRSATVASRSRTPGATSWRHLFHGRSRSALGHQADQDGPTEDGRTVQTTRHRAGTHAPARARQYPLFVHDAQIVGGAVRKISLKKAGIKGVFCGGTEMTPQFHRFAVEELLEDAYFAPTYGNTLMGLAVHKPRSRKTTTRSSIILRYRAR